MVTTLTQSIHAVKHSIVDMHRTKPIAALHNSDKIPEECSLSLNSQVKRESSGTDPRGKIALSNFPRRGRDIESVRKPPKYDLINKRSTLYTGYHKHPFSIPDGVNTTCRALVEVSDI